MAQGSGNRSRLLLVILLVTALFFVTLDLRGVSLTKESRSITQTMLSPVQKTVSTIFSPLGRFLSDVKNFGKTKTELDQALAQNKKLSSQLVLASETKGESAQLNGVLDLAGRGGYKVVAARVIGHGSASSFSQTITINQGSRSGIKKDMTVISQNGLVGLVKNITSTSAIVLLMSDPSFKVGVKITRSQSIGILQGQGNSSYSFVLLDPAGAIKVGDNLVTNGSDNNHPFIPGVPVGHVTVLDNSTAALVQSATVESYANLNDLGVVSVVLAAPAVAPSVPLRPTPNPTVTVLVTPTPTPSTSTTPTVSPSPTTSIKKK